MRGGHLMFFSCAVVVFCLPYVTHGQIIISEIMYNPKGADTGREWIEFSNDGTSDVTLVGGTVKGSWRIGDGTNHTITDPAGGVGRGTLVVPAGGYLVVANDPATFVNEYPGGTYSIVKSSLSLSNTGTTIVLVDGSGTLVDSVAYTKDFGGNDDGTSLQKTGTSWIAALPTPGAVNATTAYVVPVVETISTTNATTTASNATTTQEIMTPSQSMQTPANWYVAPPRPALYADGGGDRVVIVGADIGFDARAYDRDQQIIGTARFVWNFGDGSIGEGESVQHHFSYPGRYAVMLTIAYDRFAASDEIIVTAEPAALAFSVLPDGGAEIENRSGHGLDLSGWIVRESSWLFAPQFILPEHSKVLSGASMRISPEVLKFKVTAGSMFEYPNGALALSAGAHTVQSAEIHRASESVDMLPPVSQAVVRASSIRRAAAPESIEEVGAPVAIPSTTSTSAAQAAAVATVFPKNIWWLAGMMLLLGISGIGVVAASRVKNREWQIVEETSD